MNAIYVRVSTEDQARHGYSLDYQLEACRRRLSEAGITSSIEEFIDDGYSGEFLERPALSRLREFIFQGAVSTLIIHDPDRMSRNLANQLILADEIEKAGVQLLFVTGDYDVSPEGRLFFALKGAVAAYEKAKIRDRTTRGRRQKASTGKIVSNARPFGYGWNKEASMYVVDAEQADIVRMVYSLFLEHNLGCRSIARELKSRGIAGPKGKPLSDFTVYKILSREMYCGTHYLFRQQVKKVGQNKRVITNLPQENWQPVAVPAIISRDLWEEAQLRLKRNKKSPRRACRHEYLLQGVIHCSECGRAMIGTSRPSRRKKSLDKLYSYYTCITKESARYSLNGERCECRRIPVAAMDSEIWRLFSDEAKFTTRLEEAIRKYRFPDYAAELEHVEAVRKKLQQRHQDIARLIREGFLDAALAEEELQKANKELAAANNTILDLQHLKATAENSPPGISPDEILAAVTFAKKREILLKSGLTVYAVRKSGAECVAFYLD